MRPSIRRAKILVIDDVPEFLQEVSGILSPEFRVSTCACPLAAVDEAENSRCDLVITTLVMKEIDGLEVIRRIRGRGISVPIVMVTGHGTANTAIEALRLGATDYLSKPVEPDELRARVRRAVEAETPGSFRFQTRNPAMLEMLKLVRKVAGTPSRVLITGETGTGKELIARMLHHGGARASSPFVAVNCAAIPHDLIESELFGHERGAFTGALKQRVGRFEEAGEGTFFLDEIGELSIALQSKLLRVLQEGEFHRVGGSSSRRLKARIVAATNRDLRLEVRAGRFREDLYFRLHVVRLLIPPLRERKEDIRLLAGHFIRRFASSPRAAVTLTPSAWTAMERYDWPGNVRELEHFIERLSVLHAGEEIDARHMTELDEALPFPRSVAAPYTEALAEFRQSYFRNLLASCGGSQTRAAKLAGMDKAQFHRTIVRLGLHSPGR